MATAIFAVFILYSYHHEVAQSTPPSRPESGGWQGRESPLPEHGEAQLARIELSGRDM
jgi:hypothetical protein